MGHLQLFPRCKERLVQVNGIISQQLEHIRQAFTSRIGKEDVGGCLGRLKQIMEGRKYIAAKKQLVRSFLDVGKGLDGGRVMR